MLVTLILFSMLEQNTDLKLHCLRCIPNGILMHRSTPFCSSSNTSNTEMTLRALNARSIDQMLTQLANTLRKLKISIFANKS